ncbi:MAG: phosphoribosylaminoimidazolesuccinocarboxamide synthase [Patescibacteria group bacterium]|nr:phosphoribosylaminoimidazolesuccinocarboxamide synthase [Patescibacteria group bacterium]
MQLTKLGNLILNGSAKDIYALPGTDDIAFRFLDTFSVFDVGRADYEIKGKGQAVCACAVQSFFMAQSIGIPTHFVEQLDQATIRVKRAQVITGRSLTPADANYVVPAEWIYRLRVAGSIHRNFSAGDKNPEDYGLPAGAIPRVGTPFPWPVHHFTTKFEDIDRDITFSEACAMAGITEKDALEFWSMIDRLTGAIGFELNASGFALVDGKMECLMGPNREKLIGDVFGTPDEDRFCLLEALEDGRVEHYSKEYLRQLFIEMGYYDELKAARKAGQPDPPIPRLPEEKIEETRQRYIAVAANYSGVSMSE